MIPEIRLEGFEWVPYAERKRKYAFPPRRTPLKHENDSPLFWLASMDEAQGIGTELFLVNNTGEMLPKVAIQDYGFTTIDDESVSLTCKPFCYTDVPAGAAIKVATYDNYYDLDYMIGIEIVVEGTTFSRLVLKAPPKKGGVRDGAFWWENSTEVVEYEPELSLGLP